MFAAAGDEEGVSASGQVNGAIVLCWRVERLSLCSGGRRQSLDRERAVKFGLFVLASSPEGDYRREYEEILEQALLGEELGFGTIWLAEHHGSNYGTVPNPAVLAAAVAERTTRIRIGVAVSILPFQHPVRVAEDWAMVDVLSDGRLDFAAGRGYQPREFRMLGADPSVSREVFAESLDAILGLWSSDGPFSYEGEFVHIDEVEIFPKPVQKPIPVWVAALSKPTFELMARKGLQMATTPALLPLEELKRQIVVAARMLIEQGRAPETIDFPMTMTVIVAPTRDAAFKLADEPVDFHYSKLLDLAPGAGGRVAPSTFEAYEEVLREMGATPTTESLMETGIVLVGDLDDARARIAALRDEVGLKQFVCGFASGGTPHADVTEMMRLFAAEVMPAFEEETPVPEAFLGPGEPQVVHERA